MRTLRNVMSTILALSMALALTACGGTSTTPEDSSTQTPDAPAVEIPTVPDLTSVDTSTIPGLEDGVFTIGMECAYPPYNWTQMDDSNGAVKISNMENGYANGYDIMIAKRICDAYGLELEVLSSEWGSLTPGIQSGIMDANIAGQSMTAERMNEVDMAGPYYYATIVCLTNKDSDFADAKSIADLAGGRCTAQSGTIWYDSCLTQIPDADRQSPADNAPAMLMALETGTVDYVCTDMPTAMGACAKNPNLTILDFSGTDGDFQFASEAERAENVNIGMAVAKGNTALVDAINAALEGLTAEHFNALMNQAISVQPAI